MHRHRSLWIFVISFLFVISITKYSHLQENDPEKVKHLSQQVMELYQQGRYAEAIPIAKKVLAICEKALGPNHQLVASNLNNLAWLYYEIGEYSQAEPLYKRALTIYEEVLGPEHPHVAQSLNNLASLYYAIGDYGKAESLYKRSLAIWGKALGAQHPHMAASLNNLAFFYYSIGDYDRAEPLYKRALAILDRALGSKHPNVAACLNNLASLYYSRGDYMKAEPLYKRALAIFETALGPQHPQVAENLNNLAALYHRCGDYDRAEPLYNRALAIRERVLGSEHPDVALTLNNLAALYAATNNFHQSHHLFTRAQQIDDKLIDQVMGFTSEEQKMKFLATRTRELYSFLSLIDRHLCQNPTARRDALNVWLRRKGIILEAQKRFQEALVYSDDPQAMNTFQELARVRAHLSKLAFSGPGKQDPEAYKRKIAHLEAQKERLEATLSQLSQAFALKQKVAKADCEKVARALPANTVLIDFARADMFNFQATAKEKKWLPAHYLAFVLHAGTGDNIGLIDLGDADQIDKAVSRFKKQIVNIRDMKGTKAIKASQKIYTLVFAPLTRELGSAREMFISPDGNLNLIPFEVLQGPDGRYLIEDYTFNYLAAGRDVLGFGQIKEHGQKALLMGDPNFDMGTEEKHSTLRKLALTPGQQQKIPKRSLDMRGFNFTRLPGTREEVRAIQALLGEDNAELYTGDEALEEVLRRKGAPRILHLATHGFFLGDLEVAGLIDEHMARSMQLGRSSKAAGKKFNIENPLLRSGIALAGANNALQSGDTEKSDGIVTAEKILGLRLRGTDMVVISACETGLGEVKTGEGVFGLRRAFTQAGAKILIMSLWPVSDKETKELMVQFYQNILSGTMDRCQALRQAALTEMKTVKERYGHTNPLLWGAFVFMGEP